MDDRTLTALKGSIAKWEGIVEGTIHDQGPKNCPLCVEFFRIKNEFCTGCPVYLRTNQSWCDGTPYVKFDDYVVDTYNLDTYIGNPASTFIADPEYLRLAQAELDFLRSLLPQESPK